MEQPLFGRRLKELRRAGGLSQAALAGEEISTGYLSRLESGARQPTERVITYLAKKLGVDSSAFQTPSGGTSLAQALSIASSANDDEATEKLVQALEVAGDEDLLPRWQALWLVAQHWRRLGRKEEELACLNELAVLADELGLPELRCRAWSSLARCLRGSGRVSESITVADRAVKLAKEAKLTVPDIGNALMSLVSAEAEEGRLPDARAHVDELVELVDKHEGPLKAEALWSAATVRFRQGEHGAALELIERATQGLEGSADLTLWLRLRLAAASLSLQSDPPRTELAGGRLKEAEAAIEFVGTTVLRQELTTLRAHLAFAEQRYADSRTLLDQLGQDELRLTYRDRIRLGVLEGRLMIQEGRPKDGLRKLKELGEESRRAFNIDLSAEIWRILAEELENGMKT
ncbi:helix-turn-helix domain-containing protein [Streptomyces anulatus]|uniref:helix-turn-helix domain-containing protein n=1 Tax=Streptomyces anulatus TaxID=1892 RepID=UPI0036CA609C